VTGPLLAFDTATPVGSVAVGRGEEILARGLLLRPGEHASLLLPRIAESLEEAEIDRDDLEGVVVGRGPGSFTGVRIAAATARGLTAALEVPLWTFSSLAAGAASHHASIPEALASRPGFHFVDLPEDSERWPRYVLFDARGERVYGGCYRFHPDRMEVLVEPRADTLSRLLESDLPEGTVFCGDGALRHAPFLEERGHMVLPFPAGLPTGEGLLRVLHLSPDAEPEPRESRWEPDYLRGGRIARSGGGGRRARAGGAGADPPGPEPGPRPVSP
jgi:tRNA threonylcarbamoyl adenosine modification protein YeaZ